VLGGIIETEKADEKTRPGRSSPACGCEHASEGSRLSVVLARGVLVL
jgi:hypothetical protein